MSNEDQETLAKPSLKLGFSKGLNALLEFGGIVFFTQHLPASELGAFFLFQALLGVASIPADFGFRIGLEKRVSEGKDRAEFFGAGLLLKLGFSGGVALVVLLIGPYINGYLHEEAALYLAVAIILREVGFTFIHVLQGELRVGDTASIRLLRKVTWVGLGVVLVYFGLQFEGLVIALLLGEVGVLVLSFSMVDLGAKWPAKRHLVSIFDFSKYNLVAASVGWQVYNWLDVILLGFFIGSKAVGIYEVTWRVSMLVLVGTSAVATSLFPQLSAWITDDEHDKVVSAVEAGVRVNLFFSVPAFLGGSVLASSILGILFGPEYVVASGVLIILLIDKMFRAVQAIFDRGIQAADRPDLTMTATVSAILANLVLNLVLIPPFGILGAAVATTTSFMLNTVMNYVFLDRIIPIRVPTRTIAWSFGAASMMAGAIWVLVGWIQITTLPELIVYVLFGAVVYLGIGLLSPGLRRSIFDVGRSILPY